MAQIEVEIEDHLDEVDTKYLLIELRKRKISVKEINETDEIEMPEFAHSGQLLGYIKKLLGLRPWHDKKRIIQEIEDL